MAPAAHIAVERDEIRLATADQIPQGVIRQSGIDLARLRDRDLIAQERKARAMLLPAISLIRVSRVMAIAGRRKPSPPPSQRAAMDPSVTGPAHLAFAGSMQGTGEFRLIFADAGGMA